MSIQSKRLIGLTEERRLEVACHVENLHIGWQREFDHQYQRDPAGHVHIAPVITWTRGNTTYRFVPTLAFSRVDCQRGWLPVQWRETPAQAYQIDRERLLRSIEHQLITRGLRDWSTAA